MGKKSITELAGVPYAELVIRPMDSRPVVVTLDELGGDVRFSEGSSQDLAEAYVVLSLMAAVGRSLGVVRAMNEAHERTMDKGSSRGDDIPF